ncbi:MAG: hypothetical protein GX275_09120 [Clostridiales bacterium]|nr:hypothetical protein [Clostridiales bacterium]
MKNRDLYKSTFSKLHSSKDIIIQEKSKSRLRLNKAMVICCSFAFILIATSSIAYAATDGEIFKQVSLWINGKEANVEDYINENGDIEYYSSIFDGDLVIHKDPDTGNKNITIEEKDGTLTTTSETYSENGNLISSSSSSARIENNPLFTAETIDNKVILKLDNNNSIDITEDILRDQIYSCEYVRDGINYEIIVSGTIDSYGITYYAK